MSAPGTRFDGSRLYPGGRIGYDGRGVIRT